MKKNIFLMLTVFFPGVALAAPSVSDVSGVVSHGQTIIVSGSAFGVKSPAAPLFWDNGEGAYDLSSKYSGYAPTASDGYSGDNNFNLAYHSGTFRNMSNSNSHGTRFISGGHDPDGADTHGYDATRGANVGMVISYNIQPFQKIYLTYYHALDPLWSSAGAHVTLDGTNYNSNHKEINYQSHNSLGVYDGLASYYYFGQNPWEAGLTNVGLINNQSTTGSAPYHYTNCTNNSAYCFLRSSIVGNWIKIEDVVDFPNQTEFTRVLEGTRDYANALSIYSTDARYRSGIENILIGGYGCFQDQPVTISSFSGPDGNGEYYGTLATDKRVVIKGASTILTKGTVGALATGQWGYDAGNQRIYVKDDPAGFSYHAMANSCGSIGGPFEHGGEPNAYRYYDDIYADTTWSRVVLANNSNFDNATIIEPQIPSAWADGSLTATVNLGKLPDSGTAYLFVFDSDNNHNTTGYPVTLGAATDNTPPTITAFVVPSASTSLTVPVTTFTATDDTGITGYIINESSSAPASDAEGWLDTAPGDYVFTTEGIKTLYAWTKDAAGNVSESLSDSVIIALSPSVVQRSSSHSSSSSHKKKKTSSSRKISNVPKTIARGQVLVQSGKKFSKNSNVALYFSKPDGLYYSPKIIHTTSTGSFSLSYRVNKSRGAYRWYAVDLKTGKKSKSSKYTVM